MLLSRRQFLTTAAGCSDFAWPLISLIENRLFTLPIRPAVPLGTVRLRLRRHDGLALINVIPMVVVFLVFQGYFVQGFSRSGLR